MSVTTVYCTIFITFQDGKSSLMFSSGMGHTEVTDLLEELGAEVSLKMLCDNFLSPGSPSSRACVIHPLNLHNIILSTMCAKVNKSTYNHEGENLWMRLTIFTKCHALTIAFHLTALAHNAKNS